MHEGHSKMHSEEIAIADGGRSVSSRWNWDRIGIGLSSLCVLHCVFTPLAFLLLPALSTPGDEVQHGFHTLMAALLLPVAAIAFVRGYLHHRRMMPVVLGLCGVAVILIALVLPEFGDSHVPHLAVNVFGSILLITGHALNRRYCTRCMHHHH